MSDLIETFRFWALYSCLVAMVGTGLLLVWALVASMRSIRVDVLDYLLVFTAMMLGLAVGVMSAADLVLDDEREKETQKPKWCWQGEFAHCADDCGSMYCELTGAEWNTWNNENECECCSFGIWDEDEWRELMEDAER